MHVDISGPRKLEAVEGVDARRLEQLLAQSAPKRIDVRLKGEAAHRKEHVPGERVAIRMEAGGSHRDRHVAGANPLRTKQFVRLDHTGSGPCDVVLVRGQQAGMLGCLSAD